MSGSAADADPFAALQQRIGYAFKDPKLLREALTHKSTLDRKGGRSYERLEFLGDRVLGLIVAERLCTAASTEEGLAPRFNALVERGACARAARRAGLGEAMILSDSEAKQGGREKEALLADAAESVIAALYLDGGFDAARGFVATFWEDEFENVRRLRRDPKTALQEWAAAKKRQLSYDVMERTGPDHRPIFVVEARVEGYQPTRGEGRSKREAERAAAAALLDQAGVDV